MPFNHSSSMLGYRPDIDGLRAISVLAVVIFHAFPTYLRGGFVGVDVFFCISGYLISKMIFDLLDRKQFSFKYFYASRIRRIFPALLIVLIVCGIYAWLLLFPQEFRLLGKHIFGGILFIDNFLFCREAGYFDTASELKPLLHLWSLGIEEQFYLFFPVLIWLVWKINYKQLLGFFLIIACLSFMYNLSSTSSNMLRGYFMTQTRVWELLCGALIALLNLYKQDCVAWKSKKLISMEWLLSRHGINAVANIERILSAKIYKEIASVLGIALLFTSFLLIDKNEMFPGFWALLPIAGAVCLILAGPTAGCNHYILSHPILVWIGLLSYPLYLWHWPILSFIRITSSQVPSTKSLCAAILLSFFLAQLTYYCVERPIRKHQNLKGSIIILCSIAFLVGLLGLSMFSERLYPSSMKIPVLGEKIIRAIHEWDYPKGLVPILTSNRTTVFHVGGNGHTTLFFGDSNIEQYAPRIVEIFKTHDLGDRGAIFLTGGSCPPFPWKKVKGRPWCDSFMDTFLILAQNKQIDRIVLGASWYGYLKSGSHGFDTEDISLVKHNIEAMLDTVIAPGRKIYIVLNIPNGPQIDPSSFIKRDLFSIESMPQPIVSLRKTDFIHEHHQVYQLLKGIAKRKKLIEIDPLDFLCDNDDLCRGLDAEGNAKYIDQYHLRPTYVKNYVNYIDKTVI